MNTKALFNKLLPVLYVLVAVSCGESSSSHKDTLSSGSIKISVDDNYTMLGETLIDTFNSLYPEAKITGSYKSEVDVFDDFLKDSARVIIVNRDLTESEKARFDSIHITPHVTLIGYDGVVFIVNKDNPDTTLTIGHLGYIFSGKANMWKQINKTSKLDSIEVVFDNEKSSNARYILNKFNLKQFPSNCKATKTNKDVITYVENNPGAIGVIGVNWISDKEDTNATSFLKNTRVVYLNEAIDTSFNHQWFAPWAVQLNEHEYPLIRPINLIKREPYNGLGTGFVNFCYDNKGQKILLLMGLRPGNATLQPQNRAVKVVE